MGGLIVASQDHKLNPRKANRRDPGVQEIIDHFDRHAARFDGREGREDWDSMSPEYRFSTLKKAERDAVMEQFQACAEDFAYAARNYFWITDKSGQDTLFTLWESQWLTLQKYTELKSKGRAQKIMILKARQLGLSLLIEAMIAWRTMFFPNTNALVVSVIKEDAAFLFSLMLHIYDLMPWWLKPQRASRKEEDGLWFDNPNPDQRRLKPGLNSRVYVQHSMQVAGVGQGKRLSAVHLSEFTDYNQKDFEDIIEGDLLHAIADNAESFAFLESTGRGAGTYSHKLWRSCEQLGDRAEWYPLFLPFFFESTRVLAPPQGWRIQHSEQALRERVKSEWVRCDHCLQYMPAMFGGETRIGTVCTACNQGTLTSYVLTDSQLYWKETRRINAEAKGKEALKKHKAEICTTAEEAWQISGICVFDEFCMENVTYTIRDPNKCPDVMNGFIDSHKRFHYMTIKRRCAVDGCPVDHTYDELNFTVWELPLPGYSYSVGVDISEGIGQEYSVIAVIKVGRNGGPDEQVGIWRSNTTDSIELAYFCDAIGRMYNEAMMCIEYNTGFRSTANTVRFEYQYPNIFRWKHLDSQNPMSQKYHWFTQYNTKPLLWQHWRKWIKAELLIVRSPNTLAEMTTFQKDDEDDRSAAHEKGSYDDELMASMIAAYCVHEMDSDERGNVPVPAQQAQETEPARYQMWCETCKFGKEPGEDGRWPWGAATPENEYRCPKCSSINIRGRLMEQSDGRSIPGDALLGMLNPGSDQEVRGLSSYDQYIGPVGPFGRNRRDFSKDSPDMY